MRMTFRQLKKCAVETVSGSKLGYVIDVEFDTETHIITHYRVREHMIDRNILLINRMQVVRFESGIMIVDDGIEHERQSVFVKRMSGTPEVIAMRE